MIGMPVLITLEQKSAKYIILILLSIFYLILLFWFLKQQL